MFDDEDGDGQPDPDEAGVEGASVAANGQVVASTDEDGWFSFTPVAGSKKVKLSVFTPREWRAPSEPVEVPIPADVAIPLHRERKRISIEPEAAATVTGGVVGLALLAALVFTGIAAITQAASVRALRTTYRRHKSRELELAMKQRLDQYRRELRERLSDNPDAWSEVVQQLLTDAQVSAGTLTTIEVRGTPPRILINDGVYEFTTDPDQIQESSWFKQSQVVALDAALSSTARVEAQALWDHLAGREGIRGATLPRDADWYLVVHEMRWSLSRRGGRWKRLAGYGLAALLVLTVIGAGGYLALSSRGQGSMPWVVSTPTADPTTTPTLAPTATSTITTTSTLTPTVAPTVTSTAVVTGTQGSALRVRAQPAGEVIGSLPPGTEVVLIKGPVLEDDIRWQMVETEVLTGTGWVASEYLR